MSLEAVYFETEAYRILVCLQHTVLRCRRAVPKKTRSLDIIPPPCHFVTRRPVVTLLRVSERK